MIDALGNRTSFAYDGAGRQVRVTDARGNNSTSVFDDAGRIRLPDAVRSQFTDAENISVEIRTEGVLLRPELEESDDIGALLEDILPQDAPPQAEGRRWLRLRRNGWDGLAERH